MGLLVFHMRTVLKMSHLLVVIKTNQYAFKREEENQHS